MFFSEQMGDQAYPKKGRLNFRKEGMKAIIERLAL